MKYYSITPQQEKILVAPLLEGYEVGKEDALLAAEVFVDADLKGFTSHGIGRLPLTLEGLEKKTIVPQTELTVVKETPAIATVDGHHGLGQVQLQKAMNIAIQKAKTVGVGVVATIHVNHAGTIGYYAELAMKEGIIGIVMSNPEPNVAPFGGRKKILGTNPLAITIPGKNLLSYSVIASKRCKDLA